MSIFSQSKEPYKNVYDSLHQVREAFHREGRISDSNAKLNETVKFLAIHYAHRRELLSENVYRPLLARETFSVNKLNKLFATVAACEPFIDSRGISIFGTSPKTAFEQGDEAVAFELFVASSHAIDAHGSNTKSFDALNEAFGHHVRDNFRSNIEDAQYMTPSEVVDFMVAMASEELKKNTALDSDRFVMLDPSCGVGSFVTSWRKTYDQLKRDNLKLPPLAAIGQDKVERMTQLAAINLIFSGNTEDHIFQGNSLADGSPLDAYNGKIDLILTNPPFGAKFSQHEIVMRGQKSTPIFASAALSKTAVDSELLFVDRYLSLLKPGGLCMAILPDGVVSAKGVPAFLRQHLARRATIHSVIELPPVTFAQAGTRTKTAILTFQKHRQKQPSKATVFFAEAHDIGFEVSKRKGVPVKRAEGHNQLPDILAAFKSQRDAMIDAHGSPMTAVWREVEVGGLDAWTPRQFSVDSQTLHTQTQSDKVDMTSLADLVEKRVKRRPEPYSSGKLFISVLHVIGEGILDLAAVRAYKPITPGIPVAPYDVIISRLNPRIPRVLVVPELGAPLLCSSEFEVLRPKKGVSPFAIAYLLMSNVVQQQVHSLTAGTSASHSRVKPEKLYEIKMPWPKLQSAPFHKIASEYQSAMQSLMAAIIRVADLRDENDKR